MCFTFLGCYKHNLLKVFKNHHLWTVSTYFSINMTKAWWSLQITTLTRPTSFLSVQACFCCSNPRWNSIEEAFPPLVWCHAAKASRTAHIWWARTTWRGHPPLHQGPPRAIHQLVKLSLLLQALLPQGGSHLENRLHHGWFNFYWILATPAWFCQVLLLLLFS